MIQTFVVLTLLIPVFTESNKKAKFNEQNYTRLSYLFPTRSKSGKILIIWALQQSAFISRIIYRMALVHLRIV